MLPTFTSFGALNFPFFIQSWRVALVIPACLATSPVDIAFELIAITVSRLDRSVKDYYPKNAKKKPRLATGQRYDVSNPSKTNSSSALGTSPKDKFDRELFVLKLRDFSFQMQEKSVASDKAALAAFSIDFGHVVAVETGPENPYFPNIWQNESSPLIRMVSGQIALLPELQEGIDRIAREVWEVQRQAVTPEFIGDILVSETLTLIAARKSAIERNIALAKARLNANDAKDSERAEHNLASGIKQFIAKVKNRYEIEIRSLEHSMSGTHQPPLAQTNQKAAQGTDPFNGLGKKKHDLSSYLESSKLTDRQRDCLSMKWEYELRVSEIARRLGIHRSTVEEHIKAGTDALDNERGAEHRRKRRAINHGSQDDGVES